jgi:hypothetical protein
MNLDMAPTRPAGPVLARQLKGHLARDRQRVAEKTLGHSCEDLRNNDGIGFLAGRVDDRGTYSLSRNLSRMQFLVETRRRTIGRVSGQRERTAFANERVSPK